MRFWRQGLPLSGNLAKGDTGSVTYWLQGLPFAYSGNSYVLPPPSHSINVRSAAARKHVREAKRRRLPKRLPASLLAPAPAASLILRTKYAPKKPIKSTKRVRRRLNVAIIFRGRRRSFQF